MRKLLFLLFADEPLKLTHAFMYAIDLRKQGNDVRIILEGMSPRCLNRLEDPEAPFSKLFREAKRLQLIHGVCEDAARGGGSNDPQRNVVDIAEREEIRLLSDLDGHAGIGAFLKHGFEIVTV